MEDLRLILARLRNSVLKSNAKRYSLGLKGIPYLGYIITQEVIETDL